MKIEVLQKDITKLKADCIVNAANSSLLGGGGVDGAIHRAGGPSILEECKQIVAKQGNCPPGEAVITGAGNLPSKNIIHTVGPVWKGGRENEAEILSRCYVNSLQIAEDKQLRSIAFPNISTGVYGFPKEKAAEISIKIVRDHQPKTLEKLSFVCFDSENYSIYKRLLTD